MGVTPAREDGLVGRGWKAVGPWQVQVTYRPWLAVVVQAHLRCVGHAVLAGETEGHLRPFSPRGRLMAESS